MYILPVLKSVDIIVTSSLQFGFSFRVSVISADEMQFHVHMSGLSAVVSVP